MLLGDSLSVYVSNTSSEVCTLSCISSFFYLWPQCSSGLPVGFAEVFDEADTKLFADHVVLGHSPQCILVYSLSELNDGMPCFVFFTSTYSMNRVHDVVDVRGP